MNEVKATVTVTKVASLTPAEQKAAVDKFLAEREAKDAKRREILAERLGEELKNPSSPKFMIAAKKVRVRECKTIINTQRQEMKSLRAEIKVIKDAAKAKKAAKAAKHSNAA